MCWAMWTNSTRRFASEIPRPSRPSLKTNGARLLAGCLLLMSLTACSPRIETIQDSRQPEPLPNGRWDVTDGFLQQQGELIRGWRARAQACEVELANERKDRR